MDLMKILLIVHLYEMFWTHKCMETRLNLEEEKRELGYH